MDSGRLGQRKVVIPSEGLVAPKLEDEELVGLGLQAVDGAVLTSEALRCSVTAQLRIRPNSVFVDCPT